MKTIQTSPLHQALKKDNPVKQSEKEMQGLRQLFVAGLQDIYWAEKALTLALPKMISNASSNELSSAIKDHLDVTSTHVSRLEEVFAAIDEKVMGKKCQAMEGLIKEAEDIMESTKMGPVRDAGIISAGQKVEHYEIATYGTLCCFAKTLGETEAADLLHQSLQQEKEANDKLSMLAELDINAEAAGGETDMEVEEVDENPVMNRNKESGSSSPAKGVALHVNGKRKTK